MESDASIVIQGFSLMTFFSLGDNLGLRLCSMALTTYLFAQPPCVSVPMLLEFSFWWHSFLQSLFLILSYFLLALFLEILYWHAFKHAFFPRSSVDCLLLELALFLPLPLRGRTNHGLLLDSSTSLVCLFKSLSLLGSRFPLSLAALFFIFILLQYDLASIQT